MAIESDLKVIDNWTTHLRVLITDFVVARLPQISITCNKFASNILRERLLSYYADIITQPQILS